ncbi:MAG: hypothetical protein JNM85_03865 [Chthonomonas sp.]|nr:hypothetical protein [Chthonomonas sp.]
MLGTMLSLLLMAMTTPTITDLSWMSGDWTCEVWGGKFEERWSLPRDGTMVGTGRHFVDGKTKTIEHMTIEANADGTLTMWVLPQRLNRTDLKSSAFVLKEASDKRVSWVCEEKEFPRSITYTKLDKDSMTCVLSGEQDGKQVSVDFPFKRNADK